jgi:LmbE family N-acetylglucosaminyl deacetylase
MQLLRKIWQRAGDPVFYRKRFRDLARRFRTFEDRPRITSLEELGETRRVVLFVAHPDDETFCSGLICGLVDRGSEITVLCLTRGEGGPTGGGTREELGQVREREMREACDHLGIAELVFLDHVDPVADGFRVFAPAVSPEALAEQISPRLDSADLVISHGSGGEYWHPAHLLVHEAAAIAMARRSETPWLTFLARDPRHALSRLVNWDDPVHLRLDVAEMAERRWEALSRHQSQLGLFGRFADGEPREFIEKTPSESYSLRQPGRSGQD